MFLSFRLSESCENVLAKMLKTHEKKILTFRKATESGGEKNYEVSRAIFYQFDML